MAGLLVVYPDTLPHPQVGQFTPRERRAINREVMRPISRDRAGVRSVAFIFTPEQAREFREWYAEWVTMGGGMFAAPWPMPWGRGPNVFRFVEPPSWQLVGGALNGQGYWRVTADVELRGRGEMPELEVVTITSKLYPYELVEGVNSSSLTYSVYPAASWMDDGTASSPLAFIDGQLRDPLVAYDWPEERVQTSELAYVDGTLKAPLVTYDWPAELLKTSALSYGTGTLEVKLVQYLNSADESVKTSKITFIDGTLT